MRFMSTTTNQRVLHCFQNRITITRSIPRVGIRLRDKGIRMDTGQNAIRMKFT